MKNWPRYQKFIAAAVGATLAVLTVFAHDTFISEHTKHWISTAIAVITAAVVYVVPNRS